MNLKNFDKEVSDVIFERGEDYYLNNAITDLQIMDNGQYFAFVEGNYGDYKVEIRLDKKNNITEYQCNCPHDADICKHIVAVLLKIKDEPKSAKVGKQKKKIASWKQMIDIIPEDKFREYIKKRATKNKEFRNELIIEFSEYDNTDNIEKYKQIVQDTFSMAGGRHGFIDYYHTSNAMLLIYNLFKKAEGFLENENCKEAFSIVSAIPPECIKALQYMDDSNGECGGVISESFNLIFKIHESSESPELNQTIFEYILTQVNNKDYDDYGCAEELEPLLIDVANTDDNIDFSMNFIEEKLKEASKETGWSGEYVTKKYLVFKADLLKKSGEQKKAESIIYDNIYISEFRKIVVDKKIKGKKIKEAIQLIEEGIIIAIKKDYTGTVNGWKEKLLEIYQKQNDNENIRKYAKELFLGSRYDMNFYKILKKSWSNELWNAEKEKIIAQIMKGYIKTTSYYYNFPSPVAEIYVEEKMWAELFTIVKKMANLNILNTYTKYLKDDYSQEFIEMYKTAIENYIDENTGRSAYKTIVDYLKEMSKITGGKETAKLLIKILLEKYKNRPAMKDEFSRIKFL